MQTNPPTGDRRPLATRQLAISHRLANRLAAWGCTANGISILGMIFGLLGGLALAATAWQPEHATLWFVLGAVGVQLRLLCNMLDGMVAVAARQTSAVGELYNEIPDRISDAATLIGLGYALGGHPTLGWAAALVAVLTAYVRAEIKVAGGPMVFVGPQAKPQRMFLVTISALYAGLAPAPWQPHMESLGELPAPGFPALGLPALGLAVVILGSAITCLRRLAIGARALRTGT